MRIEKNHTYDMGMQKRDAIISAIVVISLAFFFIIGSARLFQYSLGTFIFCTLVYLTVCYLYINQISSTKWRILVVALSLGLLAVIIYVHFRFHPNQWDFETRLIYCIDTGTTVYLLLINITDDLRIAILPTTFVTEVALLVINREDSEQLNQIFTAVVSIIVYIILSTLHVKQIWDRRWKLAAIASIIVVTMVVGIILRFYWNNKVMLFAFIASINACLALVPWMWLMCAPNIKAWWSVFINPESDRDEQYNFTDIAGLPRRFTIRELETATTNFQAPIGEGASGAVFKGTLADGSTIAVKWIKWKPSGKTEFRTEMMIIASMQHVNLVRLVGFCLSPRGDRYLIYPFLVNGSLDAWLFRDDNRRSHLTWALRYRIATDVAKALAYLHHECHYKILHLDIKPANILLDVDFRALISDFGISKLIGKDESSVMTKARGTVGYFAPEMLVPNAISTKSDVYSYGMVLLELVGGRRNLIVVLDGENDQQRRTSYFPMIVQQKMVQGELMDIVDEVLVKTEEISEEEVTVLTRLALWCIQENPILRPDITEVIEMLEGRKTVHMPPESPMFVVNFLDVEPERRTSCKAPVKEVPLSANNLSISIQSGR